MSNVTRRPTKERKKILAVSSSGGHWAELLRLLPAFEGHEVIFVTTQADCRGQAPTYRVRIVPEANARKKLRLVLLMIRTVLIVLWERPDIVISTGAAPGYFALRFGHYLGARTLWLDSIANAEELSLSARLARPYADLMLTQWSHMARPEGPHYRGSVL